MNQASYKDAGVDLGVYHESMRRLPPLMHRTFSPRVIRQDGGFAGLFRLDFASRLFARNYRQPVLVACTDGVGTKLKVAQRMNRHGSVGIDLVAMCVNDALCCGAEPLLFLDYVAMPKDDPPLLEELVTGISDGCIQANCALLGGETAILPDVYRPGEYDLAGFCVGVVEEEAVIDGKRIAEMDVVIGIASSGLHSNGYSLARRIAFDIAGHAPDDFVEELGETIGDVLLRPTWIYASLTRGLSQNEDQWRSIHGIAHITGGGLFENVQRILPPEVDLVLEPSGWPIPNVFRWLQRVGSVDPQEMFHVFNMGIGFVLVVEPSAVRELLSAIGDAGHSAWVLGRAVKGSGIARWSECATE